MTPAGVFCRLAGGRLPTDGCGARGFWGIVGGDGQRWAANSLSDNELRVVTVAGVPVFCDITRSFCRRPGIRMPEKTGWIACGRRQNTARYCREVSSRAGRRCLRDHSDDRSGAPRARSPANRDPLTTINSCARALRPGFQRTISGPPTEEVASTPTHGGMPRRERGLLICTGIVVAWPAGERKRAELATCRLGGVRGEVSRRGAGGGESRSGSPRWSSTWAKQEACSISGDSIKSAPPPMFPAPQRLTATGATRFDVFSFAAVYWRILIAVCLDNLLMFDWIT